MRLATSPEVFLKPHKFSELDRRTSIKNEATNTNETFRTKLTHFANLLPRSDPSFKSYSRTRINLTTQAVCSAKHTLNASTGFQPLIGRNEVAVKNDMPVRCSVKRNGIVAGYAVNTNQGLVRTYNEDRVAIVLNIVQPASSTVPWPKCSFFGVYDLSLIHICRCRRYAVCRSRWSPYH
eukprot:TRINITY_DN10559_c0_g1_i8.p2 TRINITY_DN10559_c0_g1~~TRINITY_DN10559_c0_g1_i8.p2  ORF type:complete len:179 (-),score=28.02 TRINITY_DN10559_c0_g1_i8:17-553(-)